MSKHNKGRIGLDDDLDDMIKCALSHRQVNEDGIGPVCVDQSTVNPVVIQMREEDRSPVAIILLSVGLSCCPVADPF